MNAKCKYIIQFRRLCSSELSKGSTCDVADQIHTHVWSIVDKFVHKSSAGHHLEPNIVHIRLSFLQMLTPVINIDTFRLRYEYMGLLAK